MTNGVDWTGLQDAVNSMIGPVGGFLVLAVTILLGAAVAGIVVNSVRKARGGGSE